MNYAMIIAIDCGIYIVLGVGMSIAFAWGGFFSLVQGAIFGFGSYAFAQGYLQMKLPWLLGILFSFVVGFVGAGMLGALLSRFTADFAVISTLALGVALEAIFGNWNSLTGGFSGLYGVPRPRVFGTNTGSPVSFAIYVLSIAFLVVVAVLLLRRSQAVLLARAQAMDPPLLASLGVDPRIFRLAAFSVAGGITAIGGALFAQSAGYIDPSSFDITQAFTLIVIVVVGGAGNIFGAVVAAIFLTAAPQLIGLIPGSSDLIAQIQLMLSGAVLVVSIALRPSGLFAESRFVLSGLSRKSDGNQTLFNGVEADQINAR